MVLDVDGVVPRLPLLLGNDFGSLVMAVVAVAVSMAMSVLVIVVVTVVVLQTDGR